MWARTLTSERSGVSCCGGILNPSKLVQGAAVDVPPWCCPRLFCGWLVVVVGALSCWHCGGGHACTCGALPYDCLKGLDALAG